MNNNTPRTPDPKWHLYISLVKSILRIIAGGSLMGGLLVTGGLLIVMAEVLGIVEELV